MRESGVQAPEGAPRQKNSAPLRFRGLRKSRENCVSAESFFLSDPQVSRGTSESVYTGSDLNYPGAPMKARSYGSFCRGNSRSVIVGLAFLWKCITFTGNTLIWTLRNFFAGKNVKRRGILQSPKGKKHRQQQHSIIIQYGDAGSSPAAVTMAASSNGEDTGKKSKNCALFMAWQLKWKSAGLSLRRLRVQVPFRSPYGPFV